MWYDELKRNTDNVIVVEIDLLSQSMLRDKFLCSYDLLLARFLETVYVIIDLLIIVINLWIRMKHHSEKSNLLKTILSCQWEMMNGLETDDENADRSFNDMLHNNLNDAAVP